MNELIKRSVRGPLKLLGMIGFDPLKTARFIRNAPGYFLDLWKLKKQEKASSRRFRLGRLYPCLDDKYEENGQIKGHYFHQDLLVAKRIHHNNPVLHVDIGSRIDGFVAHVASFRHLEVFDIRPMKNKIPNVNFIQANLMNPISNNLVDYCDSLSCLHAIEHFGLGRYGDPLEYDGYLRGLDNAFRVLKSGGKFYFSTPIGPQRIEFNAHRVFSMDYLIELFEGKYHIDHFFFVDDRGELTENASLNQHNIQSNFGCNYGCGIFEMTKK